MIKKKTKIFGIALVSILTIGITAPASAAITSGSWYQPAGSYAPYTGNYYTNSQPGVGCNDTVDLRIHNVNYLSSEIQSIIDYYNSQGYVHGLDATDMSNKLDTSTSSMASNYPGYKFDTDDDDGNGNDEEAEVVSRYSKNIATNTAYYFYVDWVNRGNTGSTIACAGDGYIEMNAHESSAFGLEYNTQHYAPLGTVRYYKQ